MLQDCQKCVSHHQKFSSSVKIHCTSKPSFEYNKDQWVPEKVKILFLGQPVYYNNRKNRKNSDDFFYNPDEKQQIVGPEEPLLGTISKNIFSLLGYDKSLSKHEKLERFKKDNCCYTEFLKCRIQRYNNEIICKRTIKNCSQFLAKELQELRPENIVVMGESAAYALKNISPYQQIIPTTKISDLVNITKNNPLDYNSQKLFFIPLPLWRNKQFTTTIITTFKRLQEIIF